MADAYPSLESFVLRYIEHVGGIFEEIEPQVYSVLAPEPLGHDLGSSITFDPEALADHPAAQLLAFGNPALDALFERAQVHNRVARTYVRGLNAHPHDVEALAERGLMLATGTTLRAVSHRPLHHLSALFWFQALFASDEKVQQTYEVGIDLYYKRPARHLAKLIREQLDSDLFGDAPAVAYPEAAVATLTEAYAQARDEATLGVTVSAHERLNELQRVLTLETTRINRYFDDSRSELDERAARTGAAEDQARFSAQRAALDREQAGQLADLRRKMSLSVQMRLINLLLVWQPKIHIEARLSMGKVTSDEITLTYDLLQRRLDAPVCPSCSRPTLALRVSGQGRLKCGDCAV